MKFTIEKSELLPALQFVQRRTKMKTSIAILNHILFAAEKNSVTVTGHELDSSSQARIPADVAKDGSCAIPAETLIPLIKGMPDGAHIIMALEGWQVEIKCGRSRFKLPTLPAADFPKMLRPEKPSQVALSKDDVTQLFDRPILAINPREDRPAYSGAILALDDGFLSSAGTDGKRGLRFSASIKPEGFKPITVPRFAAEEIAKLGSNGCKILASDRLLSAEVDGFCFTTKLIDVNPLPFNNIIIPANGPSLEIDRVDALCACRLLDSLSDEYSFITLSWDTGAKSILVSIVGLGSGEQRIDCDGDAVAGEISAPANHLIDLLGSLRGERVKLHVVDSKSTFRITDDSEPSAIALQIPVWTGSRRAAA